MCGLVTTTTGWREAEALANEGCAATLDTAHEALVDATQMLEYHGRTHACQAMRALQHVCGRNGTGSWNAPTRHEATHEPRRSGEEPRARDYQFWLVPCVPAR